jgi:hypothetical protein
MVSLCALSIFFSATILQWFGSPFLSTRGEEEPTCGDEIVHPGDLIVNGNTTLLIENCTFTVTGIVKVRDNATLIVRKAELNVSANTAAVIIENDGTLIMEEAGLNLNYDVKPSIQPFLRICDVDIGDTATLDVWKSRISSKLGQIQFRIRQHGRLILNSSTGENAVDAYDDSEISTDESPIYSINLHGNASCVVKNTDIQYFSGSGQYIVSFYNSTIGTIQFVFGSSSKVLMEGRLQGFHRYWNIYSNLTVEGIECNMTLRDTNVTGPLSLDSTFTYTGMELRVLNQNLLSADIGSDSELHISNCTIKHLFCGRHDSVYSISDSEIGSLSVMDNSFVSISETKIDNLNIYNFKGALVFNNTSLNENLEIGDIPGPQFYMCGGLKFGANFSINESPTYEGPSYRANFTGSIQKFKVVRGYRVVTRLDGKPLEKVQLKLYNEEDVMIWEGITDSEGEADFNITYCKNWILPPGYYYSNHTRTWSIEAVHGSTKYTTDGKLLSETPIIFNFPMPEPLWSLWQFWVVILVFIVIALFTTLHIQIRRKTLNKGKHYKKF